LFLDRYVGERIQFSLTYQKQFPISGWDSHYYSFAIRLFGNTDNVSVEKYSVNVVSPFEITRAEFSDYFSNRDPGEYASLYSDGGKRLLIEAETNADARFAEVNFGASGFSRASTAADFIIPLIAAAVAVLIYLFAFIIKPEKKLVTPIEFYPPANMNPAEVGYIIDGSASGQDITSIIYYWAAQGHLSIELRKKPKCFTLHKLSELDAMHHPYEREMFDKLWELGKENTVTNKNLEDKFYTTVTLTKNALKRSFTGKRLLNVKRRVWLVNLAMLVGCVAVFTAFGALWEYTRDDTFFAKLIAFILYSVMSVVMVSYYNNRYKSAKTKNTLRIIFACLYVIFAIIVFVVAAGKSLSIIGTIVIILSLAVATYSIPFLHRKTGFGVYMLERIIGLKMFLETAEKSRIKMLLEENPDYYYNILPYAQVLGVTKIWQDKFKGLLKQPPGWCYGDGADDLMRTTGFMSVSNTLSHSMTSSPSSSGGGSSGGGGGSFSGGGSSGGGGGGGGGRW
jgi:uncharacterized membrane protein YgcG